MNAQEIARLYNARKVGKGRWQAKCVVHRDRTASLEIKAGRNPGTTVIGCYAGCSKADVLAAKGLTLRDLFADSGYKPSPERLRQWADEERLRLKERQHGLAIMAQVVMPEERRYWAAVERNLVLEIRRIRDRLFPHEKQQRERESEVRRIIAEYGVDELMERVPWPKK